MFFLESLRRIKPEILFAWSSLAWGILFLVITPPFRVPDEYAHFWRAYQISEGTFVGTKIGKLTGGSLPKSLQTLKLDYFDHYRNNRGKRIRLIEFLPAFSIPLNSEDREPLDFINPSLYSPIPYFPQALGILPMRLAEAPPLFIVYAGRLVNLLVATLVTFFAIRVTPLGKWWFLLLSLLPMTVFERASLAADSFTNAIALLFVALVLRFSFDKKSKLRLSDWTMLAISGIALSLSKQVYFLLALLYFLIPKSRVGSARRYYLLGTVLVGLCLVSIAGWSKLMRPIYNPTIEGNDLDTQLSYLLAHPIQVLGFVMTSYFTQAVDYWEMFVGRLGYLEVSLPRIFYWLAFLGCVGVALTDQAPSIEVSPTKKIFTSFVLISSLLLIGVLIYLTGMPVAAHEVVGFQGRYFIPIVPLTVILLQGATERAASVSKHLPLIVLSLSCLLLVVASIRILGHFYTY